MQLIIARPSPFARKVRIALHEKGLAFTEIIDVPWNPGAVTAAHNPLGKVPVLLLADGRRLYDSRVIVEYLETLPSTVRLLPDDPAERVVVRQIEALADGICDAIVLIVLERARPEALRSRDWVARQQAKVVAGLAELSVQLGDAPYFATPTVTVADIAAGAALAYCALRLPDFDWHPQYANLVAFSARMEQRSSFARTRPEPQDIAPVL